MNDKEQYTTVTTEEVGQLAKGLVTHFEGLMRFYNRIQNEQEQHARYQSEQFQRHVLVNPRV
ncbi:MAG: hypothetical protein V1725_00665 [archaeon]